MIAFNLHRANGVDDALRHGSASGAKFIAGGTNLVDLMKAGVETPDMLVDVSKLPLAAIATTHDGGVSIGAMARNSDVADHPLIRDHYPLLAQALAAGASPQLRNMATVGGNLLQRTRCHYFYDIGFARCNKRMPGSGCAAVDGRNRQHAILGASPACVAVNPSDMSVALHALDAVVVIRDGSNVKRIPIANFHRLPGNAPQNDTNLPHGALILAVELPKSSVNLASHYLKLRDRASYAFALVSVAAALHIDGGRVADARIALGGVAHRPWRIRAAENALIGKPLNDASIGRATDLLLDGARPLSENRFKIALARQAVRRALTVAEGTS